MSKATLAVIVGNRDFFPDRLVTQGRKDFLAVLKEMDIEPVVLGETDTKLGAVETWEHVKRCAELFRANRERIDGILVTLPNFGDEKGVAETINLSALDVPVLVQAYPDDLDKLGVEYRRDAFCGKISVCNNLVQQGIPFSLTELHTVHPSSDSFRRDLAEFVGVCRVVKGMRKARLGAIGARPNAFTTVRYSEKILQDAGISVSTIDLSEVIGAANALSESDPRVQNKLDEIRSSSDCGAVPEKSLSRMAKMGVVISEWMEQNDLDATAIQCWTAIQQNYGINVCALMSIMSEKLMPSACEVDVTGALSMYALQLASGTPSALADWNNNYGDDPNKCVLFHCGNWPKSLVVDPQMKSADILATTLGQECTQGALSGRTMAGPMTFARITTDDSGGEILCYVGEGEFTDDPLDTFGTKAVVEIPEMQELMRFICENGFEHHVAMNASRTARILTEAFDTYLGWEVYHHQP